MGTRELKGNLVKRVLKAIRALKGNLVKWVRKVNPDKMD